MGFALGSWRPGQRKEYPGEVEQVDREIRPVSCLAHGHWITSRDQQTNTVPMKSLSKGKAKFSSVHKGGPSCWWSSLLLTNQTSASFVLQVTVNNEESDESFDSSWSYMQHIQSSALWGHDRRKFHKEVTESKVMTHIHLVFDLLPFNLLQPDDVWSYVWFRLTDWSSSRIKWNSPNSKTRPRSISLLPKTSGGPRPPSQSHTTTLLTASSSRHMAHTTSLRAHWGGFIKPCWSWTNRPSRQQVRTCLLRKQKR